MASPTINGIVEVQEGHPGPKAAVINWCCKCHGIIVWKQQQGSAIVLARIRDFPADHRLSLAISAAVTSQQRYPSAHHSSPASSRSTSRLERGLLLLSNSPARARTPRWWG
ncbi:hypothetical protein QAD02_013051 [Eretmocerus hayati]|uniref:Uncharacterized protein n=1 Tax=Eretmocerus hayati TaxID=131215 RepID=A0ACC2P1Q7_9HYME|nr:hypothetical protein QAD02_013051 [Eretmocerus hayati]